MIRRAERLPRAAAGIRFIDFHSPAHRPGPVAVPDHAPAQCSLNETPTD